MAPVARIKFGPAMMLCSPRCPALMLIASLGYVLTAAGFSLWHVMVSRKIEAVDQAKAVG